MNTLAYLLMILFLIFVDVMIVISIISILSLCLYYWLYERDPAEYEDETLNDI